MCLSHKLMSTTLIVWRHSRLSFQRCLREKVRDRFSFFLDLFSHFFVLSILAILFYSCHVSKFPGNSYFNVKLNLPPSFLVNTGASRAEKFREVQEILSGPLPLLDLEQYLVSCEFLRENFFPEIQLLTRTPFRNSARTILKTGTLYFAPDSDDIRSLVNFMNATYPKFKSIEVKVLPSENSVLQTINSNPKIQPFGFIHLKSVGNSFDVNIRQAHDSYFSTNTFVSDTWTGFDLLYVNYWMGGFYSLQRAVESWRCNQIVGCDLKKFAPTAIIPYPTPPYEVYSFFALIGPMLGVFICLISIFPVADQAKCIADDKESGVLDLFYMMGLNIPGYLLGTFTFYFLLYGWISLTSSGFLSLTIFSHTSFAVIFALIFIFHFAQDRKSVV